MIGPCGIVCEFCPLYSTGDCEGCLRGDLCPEDLVAHKGCPVLRCAARRSIPYCARDCDDFPCALYDREFPACWTKVAAAASVPRPKEEWNRVSQQASLSAAAAPRRATGGLRVFCLGSLRVVRGSVEVKDADWGRGKGPTEKIKALFGYLLDRRSQGARKETLVELLWPDQMDEGRASASLHLALHCLRRALQPDLKRGAPSSYIRYEEGRYRFDPLKPWWLDADVFEANCRRAQEAERHRDLETAMLYWTQALDLYRGDYMAGIRSEYTEGGFDAWCFPRRQALVELHLSALLAMARYHQTAGEKPLGLQYAKRALEIDPTSAAAHRLARQCMDLAWSSGEPVASRAQ